MQKIEYVDTEGRVYRWWGTEEVTTPEKLALWVEKCEARRLDEEERFKRFERFWQILEKKEELLQKDEKLVERLERLAGICY